MYLRGFILAKLTVGVSIAWARPRSSQLNVAGMVTPWLPSSLTWMSHKPLPLYKVVKSSLDQMMALVKNCRLVTMIQMTQEGCADVAVAGVP